MGKKTSIYLTDELRAKLRLDAGRGISEAIHMAVDRYQEIVGSERRRLEALFTPEEWNAMRSACNGTMWVPAAAIRGGVLANIEDTYEAEVAEYGAERGALIEKLRGLTVAQQFALVEMLEAWWAEQ
jgi:hypothetical protein